MKAEIYTKDHCTFCVKAKHLLNKIGAEITEVSAVDNRETLIERVTHATGAPPRTVPQIWLDGQYIGGHDQLVEAIASGKITVAANENGKPDA
jgi:glutaredoxin 3